MSKIPTNLETEIGGRDFYLGLVMKYPSQHLKWEIHPSVGSVHGWNISAIGEFGFNMEICRISHWPLLPFFIYTGILSIYRAYKNHLLKCAIIIVSDRAKKVDSLIRSLS